MSDVPLQYNTASFIDDARHKLREMIHDESRFPGDAGEALKRLIGRYRLQASRIHTLLYRDPADISVSVYVSVCRAYEAELDRQEALIAGRRTASHTAKTRMGAALLGFADRLDRVADQVRGDASGVVAGEGSR